MHDEQGCGQGAALLQCCSAAHRSPEPRHPAGLAAPSAGLPQPPAPQLALPPAPPPRAQVLPEQQGGSWVGQPPLRVGAQLLAPPPQPAAPSRRLALSSLSAQQRKRGSQWFLFLALRHSVREPELQQQWAAQLWAPLPLQAAVALVLAQVQPRAGVLPLRRPQALGQAPLPLALAPAQVLPQGQESAPQLPAGC